MNIAKLSSEGPSEEMIKSLHENIIKKHRQNPIVTGVCHGTRRGSEQRFLRKETGSDQIFGTDISLTATQFENTIQWDFHEIKEEWLNNFDLIYTNSLDQSYDPMYCVEQWLKTLVSNGICIIHIHGAAPGNEITEELKKSWDLNKPDPRLPKNLPKHAGDPFVATKDGYLKVCKKAIANSEGNYSIHLEEESGRECIVIKKESL